ncbi:MAG: hypothetical protein ACOCYX_03485, partial [Spirochaetota bacterium]
GPRRDLVEGRQLVVEVGPHHLQPRAVGGLRGRRDRRSEEREARAVAEGREERLDVLLSEADLKKVESSLRNRLAQQLAAGTEIKATPGVTNGFRIASRDGGVYYDFTADAVAEALAAYVTPRLAETIREAAAGA